MLRPFSLHAALGQALLHGATLPDSAAAAMTKGLSRRLLSRMVGVGNRCACGGADVCECTCVVCVVCGRGKQVRVWGG